MAPSRKTKISIAIIVLSTTMGVGIREIFRIAAEAGVAVRVHRLSSMRGEALIGAPRAFGLSATHIVDRKQLL